MPNLNYEPTSDLGEFYTPVRVSKSLRTLTASVLGDNFENEYAIWDCCCGHFALTHELNILDDSNLYCSTLRAEDIDGFQEEKGIKFQYDFLNDDVEKLLDTSEFMFGEYKMPSGLLDTLNNPNGKPILFYINPPYASISSLSGGRGSGFGANLITQAMSGIGTTSSQLLFQFLYRIRLMKKLYANKKIYISIIMPTNYLTMTSFNVFRKDFLSEFKLVKGICYRGKEFEKVVGEYMIGNMVFTPNEDKTVQTDFDFTYYETINGEFKEVHKYSLYSLDKKEEKELDELVSYTKENYVVAPVIMKSGITLLENKAKIRWDIDAIGSVFNSGNTLATAKKKLSIMSFPYTEGCSISVTKKNYREAMLFVGVRLMCVSMIKHERNCDIEFMYPNKQSEAYKVLRDNALLIGLFTANTHFIDCKFNGKRYYNKFLHSKGLYRELFGNEEELEKYDWFIATELDKDLAENKILPSGVAFYKELPRLFKLAYSKKEEFYQLHPEYQTNCNGIAFYQVKNILKEFFKEEYKEYWRIYRNYEKDLIPYVYKAGYLNELPEVSRD